MNRIVPSVMLTLIIACKALSQSTNAVVSAEPSTKGEQGIRLLITASTNVVEIGSAIAIHALITNSSASTLYVWHSGALPHDFQVTLTDHSGKQFDLTPKRERHPVNADFGSLNLDIPPNTERTRDISIGIPTNTLPGKYRLELARGVQVPSTKSMPKITSNPIEIELFSGQ